jgi:hypothetical protein
VTRDGVVAENERAAGADQACQTQHGGQGSYHAQFSGSATDVSQWRHVNAMLFAASSMVLAIITPLRGLRGARSRWWSQEIHEVPSQRLVVTAEVTGAFTTEGPPRASPVPPFTRNWRHWTSRIQTLSI